MSNGDAPLTAHRTDTTDGARDVYDHAISLVDTTISQSNSASPSRQSSPNPRSRLVDKLPSHTTVRDHLARRKFAKWQQERLSAVDTKAQSDGEGSKRPPITRTRTSQRSLVADASASAQPETTDQAGRRESSDRGRTHSPHHKSKKRVQHTEQPYEVDILYENQRGLFFFGIPLYSHSSLLNFDPSPWVTKDLKDSAVNITNAQVPDPSWQWAWKSWYVDMSHDVDEEGWQYSFSFGRKWAWHGTHPWFHSYVRRRRWLRKRVRKHGLKLHGDESMHAAHMLTGDYFTIHPKRDKSPASTLDGAVATAGASYPRPSAADKDEVPEDVKNIGSLLKTLRLSPIDREKISAVKRFVRQSGDELGYLVEHISEVMSVMVFQTSRQQLLDYLKHAATQARKHYDEQEHVDSASKDAKAHKIDSLDKIVQAAEVHLQSYEYFHNLTDAVDANDELDSQERRHSDINTTDGASTGPTEDNPVNEIKGISEEAELGADPTLSVPQPHSDERENGAAPTASEKGKGKAIDGGEEHKEQESQSFTMQESQSFTMQEPPERLPVDAMLVSDEEEEA